MRIEIIFSKSRGFSPVSWLIEKIEDTPYSHSAINFKEQDQVFESTWATGVHTVPYVEWLRPNNPILQLTIDISEKRYDQLVDFAIDHNGDGYDYGLIFRIFWRYLKGVQKTRIVPHKYICSMLVAYALSDVLGINEDEIKYITPKNIYNLAKQLEINLRLKRETGI